MKFGKINGIIVFGGTERAVNLLENAAAFKRTVVSGERLLGASLSSRNCSLGEYLSNNGITYHCVENIKSFDIDGLLDSHTLGFSLGAPWIFDSSFVAKFKGRLVNGHGAKLPQNRGAGDYSWQIMRGLNFGYHLIHKIDGGVDTGNIIMSDEFLFPHSCRTPLEYKNYYIETEIDFFKEFVRKLQHNEDFHEIEQQGYFSTYFPRLSTVHHGLIDWSWGAKDIERFICAFDDPYPGASSFYDGKKVFLKKARTETSEGTFHPFMSGLVYRRTDRTVFIAVKDGSILVEEICDENGNDFMNIVKIGHRLVTPVQCLDDAKSFYAIYTTKGLKI
jgi:methionyl-tRNA formyltransferase